jgi:hypothetical protein
VAPTRPKKIVSNCLLLDSLEYLTEKIMFFFLCRDQLMQAPWLAALSWLRCDAAAAVLVLLARLGC